MFYSIHTSIHEMHVEFWEIFARKFPKLKQLLVLNLTQVQRAGSKTETTTSFEPTPCRFELNSGIVMNKNLKQLFVS
jgi:hypothetical protein